MSAMKKFYVKGEVVAVRREDRIILGFIKFDKIWFEAPNKQAAILKAKKAALHSLLFWKELASVDIISKYPMRVMKVGRGEK
jgi:hypothetical protein